MRVRLTLSVVFGALLLPSCETPPPRPNVLLVTLDTTRADHLGCYGYTRATSPRIDELAAEAQVYERAVSTASWTLPAHASLFTGKFTASHGARYDSQGPLQLLDAIDGHPGWKKYRARGLAVGETTLAGLLRAAGYDTGAVVGGPWMKSPFGLNVGFDTYDDDEIDTAVGRLAEGLTDRAIQWVSQRRTPFFLFLNYYDPHSPYGAPDEWRGHFLPAGTDLTALAARRPTAEEVIALYDGEIRYMDFHIGRLLDFLRERGLYEHSWIIITADHGELLGEHGLMGHGKHLTQPELHIPMIVKRPGPTAPRGRVSRPIQQVDVLPTILAGLGLPIPAGIQGHVDGTIDHPILAEAYPLEALTRNGHWRTIIDGDTKLLWNSNEKHALFDLRQDPGEESNLLAEQRTLAAELNTRLHDYLSSLPAPRDAARMELDPETREALKTLGYVD